MSIQNMNEPAHENGPKQAKSDFSDFTAADTIIFIFHPFELPQLATNILRVAALLCELDVRDEANRKVFHVVNLVALYNAAHSNLLNAKSGDTEALLKKATGACALIYEDHDLPQAEQKFQRAIEESGIRTCSTQRTPASLDALLSSAKDARALAYYAASKDPYDPLRLELQSALSLLAAQSSPFAPNKIDPYAEICGFIENLKDLGSLGKLGLQYADLKVNAYVAAERFLQSCRRQEQKQVLIYDEVKYGALDRTAQAEFESIYKSNKNTHVVLGHAQDYPAVLLSTEEIDNFLARLEQENEDALYGELIAILKSRGEKSKLAELALSHFRKRDLRTVLERLHSDSLYEPDSEGTYVVRKPQQVLEILRQFSLVNIPVVAHQTIWIMELKTGTATPVSLRFQAKYLPQALEVLLNIPT